MGKRLAHAAGAAVLFWIVGLVGSAAQSPPPNVPQKTDEALAWDRDFDLLLDASKTPTRAEAPDETRRKDLAAEREQVEKHLADLKARMDRVSGTYTTEMLLNEMIRQGVSDLPSVQANLRLWMKADEDRLGALDKEQRSLGGRER